MIRSMLTIVCLLAFHGVSSAQWFDRPPFKKTPLDPRTHNPLNWLPRAPATSSSFGVDPAYISELNLFNRTNSTLTLQVEVHQQGKSSVRLSPRTVGAGASATWSGINLSEITLVTVTGTQPGSSVVLANWSLRPTNGRRRVESEAIIMVYDVTIQASLSRIAEFTGTYSSNHGTVRLTQNGNHVNGIVTYPSGKSGVIAGYVKGNRLEYQWQNATHHGTGELTLSNDGRSASGGGRDNQGAGFSWTLRKQ